MVFFDMSWCTSGVGLPVNSALYRQSAFGEHSSPPATLLFKLYMLVFNHTQLVFIFTSYMYTVKFIHWILSNQDECVHTQKGSTISSRVKSFCFLSVNANYFNKSTLSKNIKVAINRFYYLVTILRLVNYETFHRPPCVSLYFAKPTTNRM